MMGFSKAVLLFSFCLVSGIACFDSVDTSSRKDGGGAKDKLTAAPSMSNIQRPYFMHPLIKPVKLSSANYKLINKRIIPGGQNTFQDKLATFSTRDNKVKSTVFSLADAAEAFAVLLNNPIINPATKGGKAKTVIQKVNTPDNVSPYIKRSEKTTSQHIADTLQSRKHTSDDNVMIEQQLKSLANEQKENHSFVKSVVKPLQGVATLQNNITGNKTKRMRPGRLSARCDLDSIDIDLSFSEVVDMETGEYLLTCSGSVTVNKCEGACVSSVSPSVNHVEGFEKICSCCRDASLAVRSVSLTSCLLGSQEVVGYSLSRDIVEPTSCGCTHCAN